MFKLALLDLKRKKKSWRLLISVMTLAYAFLAMMLICYASFDRTEEAEREAIYGSWHVALIGADQETMERVKNHATVESAGISYTYGMVLDHSKEEVGRIGTADENTMKMENISLMRGRFPEKEGEVAAEMSSLTALGYSAQLDQQIPVYVRVREDEKNEETEQTYNLVGIVQDYSAKMKGTTPDKKDYVSFFVKEKAENKLLDTGNIICALKENSMSYYQEILRTKNENAYGVVNNYSYLEIEALSSYGNFGSIIERIIIVIVYIIICCIGGCVLMSRYEKSQQKNILLLKKMGLVRKSMNRIFDWEILMINTAAFIAGNFLGGIILITLKIISKNDGKFLLVWNKKVFLIGFVMFLYSNIFMGVCSHAVISRIFNLKYLQKRKREVSKENRFSKRILGFKWKLIENLEGKQVCFKYIGFVGIFIVMFSGFYIIRNIRYDLDIINGNVDYSFGGMDSYYPSTYHIKNDVYARLKKVYGVENIQAYKSLNYLPIYSEKFNENNYIEILKKRYWSIYTEQSNPQGCIVGIEKESKLFQNYKKNFNMNVKEEKRFEDGKGVFLYLPNYYTIYDVGIGVDNYGEIAEEQFEKGDIIYVGDYGKKVPVEIIGIIREYDESKESIKIFKPVSLIGSYRFCDLASDKEKHDTFEYITISLKDNINGLQSKSEITQIASEYKLLNTNDIYRKYLKIKVIYYYIYNGVIIICLILFLVLCSEENIFGERKKYKRLMLLHKLGVSNAKIYYENFKLNLYVIAISWVIAFIIYILWYVFQYCCLTDTSMKLLKNIILHNIKIRMPWLDFVFIGVFIGFTWCFCNFVKIKKFLKKSQNVI